MPTPRKDQTEEEWMHECMGSQEMMKSFPQMKQRVAVCISKWKNKDKKSKSEMDDEVSQEFLDGFLAKHPEYKKYFEEVEDGQDKTS